MSIMPTVRIINEHENDPHFLTLTVIEWIDVFTGEDYFKIIINTLKYCQENLDLLLYDYVIMTNHLHLIVAANQNHKLSEIIAAFKKFTTKEIYKLLAKDNRKYILWLLKNSYSKKKDSQSQLWQRENFPKLIESDEFLAQKADYIHQNPIIKGYAIKPEDWKYSSARNRYLNDESVIAVENYPT